MSRSASSTSSLESAASALDLNEPAASAPSPSARSTPTVAPCCESTGLMCPSSTTCEGSMLPLFPMEWTSSAEASLASPSLSPGSSWAGMTFGTCGPSTHESSESSDPVGYLLRTSLASELSRQTKCSPTWKRQATPAGRSWWVLMTSVHRIGASGFGSLPDVYPTPQAIEGGMSIGLRGGEKTLDHLESHGVTGRRMKEFFEVIDARLDLISKERRAERQRGRSLWPAGLPDQASRNGSGKSRGRLNHRWALQLMGYPSDWTALSAEVLSGLLATPSSRKSSKRSGGRS